MNELYSTSGTLMLAVLVLAMMVAFIRLARGPSLADRVVALDFLTVAGVGAAAAGAVAFRLPFFLDVAILLALIGFIGTAAFASFIERKDKGWP